MREEIHETILRSHVGVNRQRSVEHRSKLRAILLWHRHGFGIGDVNAGALAAA